MIEVGPQRARRRDHRAGRRRGGRLGRGRRAAGRDQLRRRSRGTVGQNEVLQPPAGQPRPVLAAEHHRRRDQQRRTRTRWAGPSSSRPSTARSRAQIGSVNFQLDGGNNTAGLRGTGNPAPNPEAVQEFRVITNNYAAEYGRYPAGIVDVVTKSGTNQFHGAVFEFFRNEKLNAKRWAPPGVAAAKDPLDRNQFGAALGGPLQQGQDVLLRAATPACDRRRPTTGTPRSCPPRASGPATSPSRRSSRAIPVTGQPFPGDIIPSSRFDPAALDHPGTSTCRSRTCRTTSSRCSAAGPAATPTRRPSSWTTTCRRTALAGAELLLPEGHRHPAAVAHRQHPVGRSRLQVEPAQPEPGRHLDDEPDDDQPAPLHLHAAVRRPRQQPDHVAGRPRTRGSRSRATRRSRG